MKQKSLALVLFLLSLFRPNTTAKIIVSFWRDTGDGLLIIQAHNQTSSHTSGIYHAVRCLVLRSFPMTALISREIYRNSRFKSSKIIEYSRAHSPILFKIRAQSRLFSSFKRVGVVFFQPAYSSHRKL